MNKNTIQSIENVLIFAIGSIVIKHAIDVTKTSECLFAYVLIILFMIFKFMIKELD